MYPISRIDDILELELFIRASSVEKAAVEPGIVIEYITLDIKTGEICFYDPNGNLTSKMK